MSPREKKLLIFFAVAGFAVINFLAIGFYKSKRIEVTNQREQARQKLEMAQKISESRDQVADGDPVGMDRAERFAGVLDDR